MTRATADYAIRARDETVGAFGSLRRNLLGSQRLFGGLGRTAIQALGAAGLGAAVKGALNSGDQIGKLATRLGATTEGLSELKHVANLSGVSFNTLTMGLQRMTRRVAEAAVGSGEARTALAELGIDAGRLSQLKPEQQFEVLAEALHGVTNESDQVRLAMKLFDSEGVALLQTMSAGADGIAAMREEARQLGLSLGGDQVQQMERANDAVTRMTASFSALTTQLASAVAPHLEAVGNVLSKVIGPTVDLVASAFGRLGQFIGGVAASIGAVFSGEFSMAGSIITDTFADAFTAVESGFDRITGLASTFASAVSGSAAPAAAALGRQGDKLLGTGSATGRVSASAARASLRASDRSAAARAEKTALFQELGLARISTGGATGGSTRPQKVESEQMAEMVALLRQMLSNDNRGARVAVLG